MMISCFQGDIRGDIAPVWRGIVHLSAMAVGLRAAAHKMCVAHFGPVGFLRI
jgi:hypothetical protein